MLQLAAAFPGYGWETNRGYGSREHLAALRRLGPTPHHRTSFAPVRAPRTASLSKRIEGRRRAMSESKKHEALIAELRASIEASPEGERRERLLARLHQLENAETTGSFTDHIKALILEAEEEAAEIAPFMSRLSSLLP